MSQSFNEILKIAENLSQLNHVALTLEDKVIILREAIRAKANLLRIDARGSSNSAIVLEQAAKYEEAANNIKAPAKAKIEGILLDPRNEGSETLAVNPKGELIGFSSIAREKSILSN